MHVTRCDLSLAWKPLRRRWGSALLVVALLATACALTTVNTSVFLFLETRPLPYANHERLVVIGQVEKHQRSVEMDSLTLENYLAIRDDVTAVERLVAEVGFRSETLRHAGGSEVFNGSWITPGYFEVLGVAAALGSTFADRAAEATGPSPLVLSHAVWQRTFGGDPGVLHTAVTINDRPHTIVGVMAAELTLPGYFPHELPDYWRPLRPDDIPRPEWRSRWYRTFALRAPGATLAQVQAELAVATERLRELFPALMADRRLVVGEFRSWLLGANRRYFLLLMATAALLSLAIAINVANLLLARVADRAAYGAIAGALGASARQMLRPLLLEHAGLALLAVIVAVPLTLAYRWLVAVSLARAGLRLPEFDTGPFLGLATLALLGALAAVPVGARWVRNSPATARNRAGGSRAVTPRSRSRLDAAAVALQTTFAVALLVVGILLAHSLRRRASANDDLALPSLYRTFLVLRPDRYQDPDAIHRQWHAIKDAVATLPEVERVALTYYGLVSEQHPAYGMIDDLDTMPANESPKRVVRERGCADYFAAVGLRIIAGRAFTEADEIPGRRLMIVSRRAAELYWPDRDPIGRRVLLHHRTEDWSEVVGVAEDLESPDTNRPVVMVWSLHGGHVAAFTGMLVRVKPGGHLSRETFQRAVWSLDPDTAIPQFETVRAAMALRQWLPSAIARLSGLLAIAAGLVGGAGIFSILNRRVAGAQREIAVRKALGAPWWRIVAAMSSQDAVAVGIGLATGSVLGLGGARALFDASNLSLTEFVVMPGCAAAVMLVVAACGALLPLARALATDPVSLLRADG